MDLSKEELSRLSYIELRQHAKKHGIKANMKAEKLISAILSADEKFDTTMESFMSENMDVDPSLNQSEMSFNVTQNGNRTFRRKSRRFSEIHSMENSPEARESSSEDSEVFLKTPIPSTLRRSGTFSIEEPVTPMARECSSEDSEVFLKTPMPSTLKRSGTFSIEEPVTPMEKQPTLKVGGEESAIKYNFRTHNTVPVKKQSPISDVKKVIISDDKTYVIKAPQPVTSPSKPPRKSILRRSQKRYSGKISMSPQSSGTTKSSGSRVNFITPDRSLFEKSNSQSPQRSVKDRPKTPVVRRSSMKRKQDFSPARKSPKQLKVAENVTTPKSVKNTFATKSDKGLQTDTPVPRSVEKKPSASATRIRLAGREVSSALSEKKRSAPEMNKVQTPNFKVIHQKAFEKMETLDEYHERKQNRLRSVTRSQQKARAENSSAKKAMQNKREQISAKSVSVQKPTPAKPSRIPQPFRGIPFIPVVKSVRKINTNFTSQSQSFLSSTKPADTGLNGNSSKKCNRNLFSAGPVNPNVFQFGKGQPIETPSTDENKGRTRRKFDLKASLSKKLPYKPHRGVLKPLTDSNLNQSQLHVSHVDHVKKKREQSREVLKGVRKNRRFELQMSRRGLC